MLKNNSYTVVFQEVWVENILSQTKSPIPIPPSKVKRSAPNYYILLQ